MARSRDPQLPEFMKPLAACLASVLSILAASSPAHAQVPVDTPECATAPIPGVSDFGRVLATSEGTLMVGAPSEVSGRVYVYSQTHAGDWELTQTLSLDGVFDYPSSRFGSAIALQGGTAVIGAPQWEPESGPSLVGAAQVFSRNELGSWVLAQTLAPVAGAAFRFGSQISIDGEWLAITDDYEVGGVSIYHLGGGNNWQHHQEAHDEDGHVDTSASVQILGDRLIYGVEGIGLLSTQERTLIVQERQLSDQWIHRATLYESLLAPFGYGWGERFALLEGCIAVAARHAPTLAEEAGAVVLYTPLTPSLWIESDFLTAALTSGQSPLGGGFGSTISASGEKLAVGSLVDNSSYTFQVLSGKASLLNAHGSTQANDDAFGSSIAVSNKNLVVGGYGTTLNTWTFETLSASTSSASLAAPAPVELALRAGPLRASQVYIAVGSVTGTAPGSWASPTTLVPINYDSYTQMCIEQTAPLVDPIGVTDADGRASFRFFLPPSTPPSIVGSTVHHAALLVDLATFEVTTTNAVATHILP